MVIIDSDIPGRGFRTDVLLNAVTAVTTGAAFTPFGRFKTFSFDFTGAATASIEVSNDGITWVIMSSGVSANAIMENQFPWPFVRGIITTYVSGTITVIMSSQ